MIVFGFLHPGNQNAENTAACAQNLLKRVADWNRARKAEDLDVVKVGIGLHYGEAFCGAIGDDRRLEFTVIGDTVNVAARLQEQTKHTHFPLIVSEAVLAAAPLTRTKEKWAPLDARVIRGRLGELRLFGYDSLCGSRA